jgi:hypothetical protein
LPSVAEYPIFLGYYAVPIGGYQRFGGEICFNIQCLYITRDPEDTGKELLQNVGDFSSIDTASYPRKLEFKSTPL